MDPNELVTVYTVTNPVQGEIIKNALEDEQIQCALEGEAQAGLTGVLEIRVMVRAADAERAAELIREHEARLAAEREDDSGDE